MAAREISLATMKKWSTGEIPPELKKKTIIKSPVSDNPRETTKEDNSEK